MFNREEKLFYKTIEQIFSIEYDKRAKSEKNIRNWLEETYGSIIEASSKFSIQEENPTNIREYCLFLIRICCEKKYLKNWNQLELKKKDDIKSNCLILLGDPKEEIRRQSINTLTEIFKICLENDPWKNLIEILCEACKTNNKIYQISGIRAISCILKEISAEYFSEKEKTIIEEVILSLLNISKDDELTFETLKAFDNFLPILSKKFNNIAFVAKNITLLTNILSRNSKEKIGIIKCAILQINKVVISAYEISDKFIRKLSDYIIDIAINSNESILIQALEFFIDLSSDEISRKEKNIFLLNYKIK